jgi:hypothetical protein
VTRSEEYVSNDQTIFEAIEDRITLSSYPNPMGDEATIEFSSLSDAKGSIDIFSSTGDLVTNIFNGDMYAEETRVVRFNASSLANGIYICKFTAGNKVKYNKIIVNK